MIMTEERQETEIEISEPESESILKIFESLPEKFYTQDEIRLIYSNLSKQEKLLFIQFKAKAQIYFIINDSFEKIIAIVNLEFGKIRNIEMSKNISTGKTGQRITNLISDVEIKRAWVAIHEHFGKIKPYRFILKDDDSLRKNERVVEVKTRADGSKYSIVECIKDENEDPRTGKVYKSLFRRNQDMAFDLVRITNGLGMGFKTEDNLNCDGKYSGYSDEELSNNILLRSLDDKDIKFHMCIIPASHMKQAFDGLAVEFYVQFLLWFMPEIDIDNIPGKSKAIKKEMKNEIAHWKELKSSQDKKHNKKAWRMKNVAVEALRLRIEMVQGHE